MLYTECNYRNKQKNRISISYYHISMQTSMYLYILYILHTAIYGLAVIQFSIAHALIKIIIILYAFVYIENDRKKVHRIRMLFFVHCMICARHPYTATSLIRYKTIIFIVKYRVHHSAIYTENHSPLHSLQWLQRSVETVISWMYGSENVRLCVSGDQTDFTYTGINNA